MGEIKAVKKKMAGRAKERRAQEEQQTRKKSSGDEVRGAPLLKETTRNLSFDTDASATLRHTSPATKPSSPPPSRRQNSSSVTLPASSPTYGHGYGYSRSIPEDAVSSPPPPYIAPSTNLNNHNTIDLDRLTAIPFPSIALLHKWTSEDVTNWLRSLPGFDQYVDVFKRDQISGVQLVHLDDEICRQQLNITNLLHRRTLLNLIDELKKTAVILNPSPHGSSASPSHDFSSASLPPSSSLSASSLNIIPYSRLTEIHKLGEGNFGVTLLSKYQNRYVVVKVPKALIRHR